MWIGIAAWLLAGVVWSIWAAHKTKDAFFPLPYWLWLSLSPLWLWWLIVMWANRPYR